MYSLDENFWIAISFITFLYFAYKPIKKSIVNSLDSKINDIKRNLAETERVKSETKLLLIETKEEMKNFEKHKGQIISKAKDSIQRLIEKRTKEIEIDLDRKRKVSDELIESKKSKVSEELKNEFAVTVISTVKNYLIESNNNYVNDEEIINKFLNRNDNLDKKTKDY